MTKKLSEAFFGDKKLTEKIYDQYKEKGEFSSSDIKIIFQPYTSKLSSISNSNNDVFLLQLFEQFMQGVVSQFEHWEFQKFSSIVQIAAHVFEYSFEKWLNKEQSFNYFSDVVVRHSLFRPPHSVCIFNYQELSSITTFWINHFHRYFEYYQECMSSKLNEILSCSVLPTESLGEKELKEAKTVDKTDVLRLLQ